MSGKAAAQFYDARMSAPRPAEVSWAGKDLLQVSVEGEQRLWSTAEKHFTWEHTADSLRLTHGVPPEVLILRDPQVVREWAAHLKGAGKKERRVATWPWLLRVPLMLPLGFIACCLAIYFWVLPWAAERLVVLLPEEVDVRMGDAAFDAMATSMTIDTARSAALQRFGDRLVLAPDFALRYHVVQDAQVNAFAMPGGHIVVYTGLLDKLQRPGELAALLAHEGTHVQQRHSTRGMARQLGGYVFLATVFGDVPGLVGAAAGQADRLQGLHYSRELESEADTVGIRRLAQNGVDPQGMVQLLEVFAAEEGDQEAVAFLSSHPLTEERLATAKASALRFTVTSAPDSLLRSAFEQVRATP